MGQVAGELGMAGSDHITSSILAAFLIKSKKVMLGFEPWASDIC